MIQRPLHDLLADPTLEELCAACGEPRAEGPGTCSACGFEDVSYGPRDAEARAARLRLTPFTASFVILIAVTSVTAALTLAPDSTAEADEPVAVQRSAEEAATATVRPRPSIAPPPPLGHVEFGESLDQDLEIVSVASNFGMDDTIVWRAELPRRPLARELRVVFTWTDGRETRQLWEGSAAVAAGGRPIVVSEPVLVDDLVPTSGLYGVTYYTDDVKAAEGVFEVYPRGREPDE